DPGTAALPALAEIDVRPQDLQVFAVGESGLATGARRYLVRHRDVPKSQITFSGYWKTAAPTARAWPDVRDRHYRPHRVRYRRSDDCYSPPRYDRHDE